MFSGQIRCLFLILILGVTAGVCPPRAQGAGYLYGLVFGDLNGNGKPDPGEPSCLDSIVTLSADGQNPRDYSLDCAAASGYHFADLQPGGYRLTVKVKASVSGSYESPTFSVTVTDDFVPFDLPVPPLKVARITGRAAIDSHSDGIPDPEDRPLPGLEVRLLNSAQQPVATARTRLDGSYTLEAAPQAGGYLVTAVVPSWLTAKGAFSPSPFKPDLHSILIPDLQVTNEYGDNDFLFDLKVSGAPSLQQLLEVGAPVDLPGRLGMFGADPRSEDRDISLIRRVTSNGWVYLLDYAGTALTRFQANKPEGKGEVVLDTTAIDADGIGLERLLRVEISDNGIVAVLALLGNGRRGIYRLDTRRAANDPARLRRLALLPDDRALSVSEQVPEELAISDDGRIAYIAPLRNGSLGPLGLFLIEANATQPEVALPTAGTERFTDLTMNAHGDLALLVTLGPPDGPTQQTVLRLPSAGQFQDVAHQGTLVFIAYEASGDQNRRPLARLGSPRIGPDGTVVFLGAGAGFVNFYAQRPGRPLQALLEGSDWNSADGTFDYAVSANGAVAVRAAKTPWPDDHSTGLWLVMPPPLDAPQGKKFDIGKPGESIQPAGKPAFVPGGTEQPLFFIAKSFLTRHDYLVDRNGNRPAILCRWRPLDTPSVQAAATPGQSPVPLRDVPNIELLTMTQSPVVALGNVFIGGLFGEHKGLRVPTAGVFEVPIDNKLEVAGQLLAREGTELTNGNSVAAFSGLAFSANGTLFFSGLLSGAGPVLGAVSGAGKVGPRSVSPSPGDLAQIQEVPATPFHPMVSIGKPLDRSDRILTKLLLPPLAQGPNRQLIVAGYTLENGNHYGEGLFSVGEDESIQALAVEDAAAPPSPSLAGAQYAAFGDTEKYSLSPPSVSPGGQVAFKAMLKRADAQLTEGLFEWNTNTSVIGVEAPDPTDPDYLLLSSPDDPSPYELERWAMDPGGHPYFLERHTKRSGAKIGRLFGRLGTSLQQVAPGAGIDVSDFAINGEGAIYVAGTRGGKVGLYHVQPDGTLGLLKQQGDAVPPIGSSTGSSGRRFGDRFELLSASASGPLLFYAPVVAGSGSVTWGLFKATPGVGRGEGVETVNLNVPPELTSKGNLQYIVAGLPPGEQQVSDMFAFSTLDDHKRWVINRYRGGQSQSVASIGQPLPGGGQIVSLRAYPSRLSDRHDLRSEVALVRPTGISSKSGRAESRRAG
jgi:hypothetical protein